VVAGPSLTWWRENKIALSINFFPILTCPEQAKPAEADLKMEAKDD